MKQTIIIKLDPAKLANPDLDLRYHVPDRIEEYSHGRIMDNGYDYLEQQTMGLWLKTDTARDSYPLIIELLQKELFLDNDLSQSAEIYISENEAEDIESCTLVYPDLPRADT